MRSRVEATSLARYGVADASQAPEVRARRSATNVERYGAANPFAKEASTFEAVQESLVGKRGAKGGANAFSRPEVKGKIRATMVERYGVENPQQAPTVRARTKATVLERYGGELLASPALRAKAEATNLVRYGAAFAGGTPEVQEKVKATNMERYGVPHTCMDPEVRRKQMATHVERYGAHWFATGEGKQKVKEAMFAIYGVDHPAKLEGWWDRMRATFQERYGVSHPLQLAVFLDKQRATNIERYGTPFPGLRDKGMNGLETKLHALAPDPLGLVFTGDGKFWRHLPKLGHHKNADFIVPGPDPEHPMRGVAKVVEAFGDFWHSRMFTGKAPFDHESELVEAYADVGIECLVVWESEVKVDPEQVRERLAAFLGSVEDHTAPGVLDLFG